MGDWVKVGDCGGLGFRDIELFNLELLACQAWQILIDPNSLSARILKAKYFPSSEFLRAGLGSSPSQIWRSMLEGRDMMKQGLTRRMGDGETTIIWDHIGSPGSSICAPLLALLQTLHM